VELGRQALRRGHNDETRRDLLLDEEPDRLDGLAHDRAHRHDRDRRRGDR
jgi:hypothetical protein